MPRPGQPGLLSQDGGFHPVRFCNTVPGQSLESVHGGMTYPRPISLHIPENIGDYGFPHWTLVDFLDL